MPFRLLSFSQKKVHELMHSFGAKHDPEASLEPECTPQDKVGTLHYGPFWIKNVPENTDNFLPV